MVRWCGGAELARELTAGTRLSPTWTPVRRARRDFGFGQPHRRDHGQCLRFVGTVDATDASDCPDTIPTRSALALKLGSLTEWQLGTLNGLPLYGVVASITVGANALT